uniref:DNA primase/helicase Gp4 N-terminal Bacteriophage T7-like domain-containing protein n=1 Tax=Bellilinea caldifistulae TaxID=360411 RepID=A0A7C4Q771_9CHLR
MKSIDLSALKLQIDLLALASAHTSLQRVAASGGGEWAGACPFCGGRDRFRVQPHARPEPRWLCRHCTDGKWQDAIAFGQRLYPHLTFREVCERLSGGRLTLRSAQSRPQPVIQPAYAPPLEEWQQQARRVIERGQENLWSRAGSAARRYLQARGFKETTLQVWKLGYSDGFQIGQMVVPRGVVIPCITGGQVWYLKIALLPGQPIRCPRCGSPARARQPCLACGTVSKYRGVSGNRTAAIFGGDQLINAAQALFVEGEFDALIAWQSLAGEMPVCTVGSASNRLDLAAWGPYLLTLQRLYAVYDPDAAGESGRRWLEGLSERTRPLHLPPGVKDVNDFILQGVDFVGWLHSQITKV